MFWVFPLCCCLFVITSVLIDCPRKDSSPKWLITLPLHSHSLSAISVLNSGPVTSSHVDATAGKGIEWESIAIFSLYMGVSMKRRKIRPQLLICYQSFKTQMCQFTFGHPGLTYIYNFWHSGTLALGAERQNARIVSHYMLFVEIGLYSK